MKVSSSVKIEYLGLRVGEAILVTLPLACLHADLGHAGLGRASIPARVYASKVPAEVNSRASALSRIYDQNAGKVTYEGLSYEMRSLVYSFVSSSMQFLDERVRQLVSVTTAEGRPKHRGTERPR